MTFVLLLAALAVEHFVPRLDALRGFGWWQALATVAASRLGGWRGWDGPAGLAVLLAPPVLGAFAVLQSLDGVPRALASLALLLYSLGPRDLGAEVERYVAALTVDELEAGDPSPGGHGLPWSAGTAAVARALLAQVNDRLCVPLFWFVCLGPVAAFAARLAWLAAQPRDGCGAGLSGAAVALERGFAWLPARLVAFGYGVAGSLPPALARARFGQRLAPADNAQVLVDAGLGALQVDDPESRCARDRGDGIMLVREVRSLIGRTLFGWLAFYAALVIAGLDG